MMLRTLFAATVFAATTLILPAQAETWTVTAKGIIDEGRDKSGVFGILGQDLAGLSFTQSITISVSPSDWSGWSKGTGWQYVAGYGPALIDTVTVNGKSVTFTTPSASGQESISGGSFQGTDGIYSYLTGSPGKGGGLRSIISVSATSYDTRFIPNSSFSQSFTQNLTINDPAYTTLSSFYVVADPTGNFNGDATFTSRRLTSISMNVLAVPEPETYAMLFVGICFVGFAARRKRMAA
jgi:hypothetical protein